jgi:UDP-N-acetylglucosamine 3-dehydrogenase
MDPDPFAPEQPRVWYGRMPQADQWRPHQIGDLQRMSADKYRYAIIGTGRPRGSEGATGFGMAHEQYRGFTASGRTSLVAIADIVDAHAQAFLADYGETANIYHDYHDLLKAEKPDVLSITVWPHLHAEITIAACEAGVRAIHCEKPMAITWQEAQNMKAAADANGTILTFNHQRRYLEPIQIAARMVRDGELGELQRIEAQCNDLYDTGTHWLDMMQFFNQDTPIEWVIGQIDNREDQRIFGALAEDQSVVHYKWTNGVRGLIITGYEAKWDCSFRLIGTTGVIEILYTRPTLRVRLQGDADWRFIETKEGLHDSVSINRACAELIRALDEPGYLPMLRVENAIRHTELYFAAWYSSLARGRVTLPLTYPGNAFYDMVAQGEIGVNRQEPI